MIAHLADFCPGASIALSFASACFWFAASITKATKPDDSIAIESHYKDKKERDIYINATAKKQTKLNAIAAALLGLALLFQIVALVVARCG
jgi:hypothetical protein